ncbi:MAG: biopolymer transporter ExbD [Bdellovibrionota bacterium]
MSASFGGSSSGQEVDLNLAPIIDCLTVLITFMLASATFLSIGILDAGVASAGSSAPSNTPPPPVSYALEIGKNYQMTLKVSGKSTTTNVIKSKDIGKLDLDQLTTHLNGLKNKWPTVLAITMTAEEDVEYKEVVKALETTRKVLPAVLLGGF